MQGRPPLLEKSEAVKPPPVPTPPPIELEDPCTRYHTPGIERPPLGPPPVTFSSAELRKLP
eukprot:768057-Hanusia_phi.AAC.1